MKSIYVGEVTKILGISKTKVVELIEEGLIEFSQASPSSRRIFKKEDILSFAKSERYKSLRKNRKILAYVRCNTKKEERRVLQKIKLYCNEENWKLSAITQLNKGVKDTNNLAFNSAVKSFRSNKVQGLIYFGGTEDVKNLVKIFQALPDLTILNAETDLNINSQIKEVTASGILRAKAAFAYS